MRWKQARRSENVEDRRRGGGAKMAMGGGIGGIVLALIAIFVFKADPQKVMQMQQQLQPGGQTQQTQGELSEEEKELGNFVSSVLAYTEDIWDELYPLVARGRRGVPSEYRHPKLVLFSGKVQSACGFASAATGPFYCPGDGKVYIDLAFYNELKERFKAPGDFAQAYVIAHEIGHHVQNMLGITDELDRQRGRISKEAYNRLSVRLELQADYFAGVWAHWAEQRYRILERGDLEEGLRAAGAIGDDRIQMRTQGYVVPDSFTHGTSDQRIRWFRRGLESGDPLAHDPFKVSYEQL